MAGESTPSAFLTGEKSSARLVSTTTGFAAEGSASKTNISNFTPLAFSGLISLPSASMVAIFLSALWKGSAPAPLAILRMNSRLMA